ncbi:MAG: acyl-CoA dehydrogenase family protein [Pseudomonadota bacterium]|nr:acyl-CoA dehydrogenase family protein [Pseudomonadota bacterium]
MISFYPSEEERALLETIQRFAEDSLAPAVREADRNMTVADSVRNTYRETAMHLVGLPESHGGVGFGLTAKVLAEEALSKTDAAQAVALDDAGLAAQAIVALATSEQAEALLSPLADQADYSLAFASAESDPAAHLGYMSARAERQDGGFVLNGEKLGVYNAARAKKLIVLAKTSDAEGLSGLDAFVVDPTCQGVEITPEDRMGLRAGGACRIRFDNVSLSANAHLNGADDQTAALGRLFNIARTVTAARIVGAARGALSYAIDYAQDRKTFGKPICGHQGLAFFIADMEVATEAARNLVLKAAYELENGEDATVSSCNAAIYACESGVRVTVDAVQVFGGAGFMKDMPVERYMRDVRTLGNMFGTSEDHIAVLGEFLYAPTDAVSKESTQKVATA